MSVQIQSSGGRRSMNAELNLVPFIDLLSVCITFLIATAVWVELSSMPVDQALSDRYDPPPVVQPLPPLTVALGAEGIAVGRVHPLAQLERVGGELAWRALDAELAADRARHEDERKVVLVTDDGMAYGDMIHALDLTRRHGYEETLLGGGPGR